VQYLIHINKSKGKRKCDVDLQSSHSSKCSTKGEKFYTQITSEFNSIKDIVIQNLKISDNSQLIAAGKSARHLSYQDSATLVMKIVNVLAEEMPMPPSSFVKMCKTLKDPHWASIILNMNTEGQ
jgi:hypothetical protein